ncbi:MAG: o-succinylbenzoate synthase [Deltaproteobacteria bacterium RBG_13_61_14]|nr:MAG: o-succinylbenzoate synthase [Deltaproteobacteria bacterium RBG_13_61_14]
MKMERADLYLVRLPLKFGFETSYGRQTHRETLLIRLAGAGLEGWGEAAGVEFPDYTYETAAVSALALERYFLPRVLGRRFTEPKAFVKAYADITGFHFARAGLECAFLDLYCQSRKLPLFRFLGGARTRIPTGISLGIEPRTGQILDRIAAALERGYLRIKVKIKPGRDLAVIAAIRRRFGPILLMADANSAYRLRDASRLKKLDRFQLMMIEQPLAPFDFLGHAQLQKQLSTPICLDEGMVDLDHARAALALRAGRIINVKFGRVGGLLAAKALHDLCRRHRVPAWCGGMLESGIGRAHNLALNTLPHFTLPGDISPSERYWEEDLIEPEVVMERGDLRVREEPGIGHRVVLARVRRHLVAHRAFR